MRALDRLAIVALIAMLTWLLFMSFSRADQRISYSLVSLETFLSGEGALHRDVLSARAGLLNNYDPLDVDLAQMTSAVNGALVSASAKAEQTHARNLLLFLRRQKALANQFKTTNALVQNSMAYFATYSGQVSATTLHPRIQTDVDRLSSAMLNLNLNGSRTAQIDVGNSIAMLDRSCAQISCGSGVRSLLAHARLLREQLPLISATIEQLIRSGSDGPVGALRDSFLRRQMEKEDLAARFRVLLYLASLLLLYLLVRWGLAIRMQTAVLHRQVALEHAVSHLSTRLIGAGPDAIMSSVRVALADLSDVLGARRVLFVGRAGSISSGSISKELESTEIDELRRYSMSRKAVENGIVRLSRQNSASVTINNIFDRFALESLYCLSSPSVDGYSNLLILGFAKAGSGWPKRQLAVLRTALDAISLSLEHASLEDERRRLESQLEHARRMETVGAFASGIAHNFNNLLGAISGQLEMVEEMDDLSCDVSDHLGQMRVSAERGHQLVKALLSYGRRHDRHRGMTAFDDLVLESRNLAASALGQSYRVELDAGAGDVHVLVDGVQLQQVILNLCHNAAQAMSGGGFIRIRTGVHQIDRLPDIAMKKMQPGQYVFVAISDEGVGIDSALQSKIFEPFFTTRASGTGLGLSTARDIVQEHGGSLTLESEVGRGTRVTILLPVPISHVPVDDAPEAIKLGSGETILYVSMSAEKCAAGEDVLAALGYEPVGVTHVSAAMDLLHADPDRFDAVMVSEYPWNEDVMAFFRAARVLAPNMARILAVHRPHEEKPYILATAHISAVLQFPLNARELAKILDNIFHSPAR